MNFNFRTFPTLIIAAIILVSCQTLSTNSENELPADSLGLKDYYEDYFPMGVAVYPKAMYGSEAELIKKQFVSLTPENVMKMGPIHPEEDFYYWGAADTVVTFARDNDMMLRGHTLCWHRQTPAWIFKDVEGAFISKELLLDRLEQHITTVVNRYKDDIYAWDVVNEVISDKPDEFYRDSQWYKISGEEYINKAFRAARAADPDVALFYNDYNVIDSTKREKIYQMVSGLLESGVPIDGVGIQGHWSIYEPTESQLRATIEKFLDLGLKIQVTELDVSVYPKEHERRDPKPNESDELSEAQIQQQADQYEMIFRVFRDYQEHLSGVTFWNISDKYSWLDNFPVQGRKDYPLLFDEQYQPKEAYWRVVNFEN